MLLLLLVNLVKSLLWLNSSCHAHGLLLPNSLILLDWTIKQSIIVILTNLNLLRLYLIRIFRQVLQTLKLLLLHIVTCNIRWIRIISTSTAVISNIIIVSSSTYSFISTSQRIIFVCMNRRLLFLTSSVINTNNYIVANSC